MTPPTIESLRVRPVHVPMRRPLVTGGGTVGVVPLALVDLRTKEGIVGRAYSFAYTPLALPALTTMIASLEPVIAGAPLAPFAIEQTLQKTFRLLGAQGLALMALAAIDTAAWDAHAQSLGVPLVRALGGAPRAIPAYNSNGLGLIGASKAAREAVELVEEGFKAVKIRLGYADAVADAEVVRAVRESVPAGTVLMSDYNQCLSVPEACLRADALADVGLAWIEEPVRHDDYVGHAEVRGRSSVPIQTGENCWGPNEMQKAIDAGACDYFMPDAIKIGGVTGWMRAAALAAPIGMPISSHLFPEVSAHLLAVTPTAHWLEFVDWAAPVLAEPVRPANGAVVASERPGIGMTWDEAAVVRFAA